MRDNVSFFDICGHGRQIKDCKPCYLRNIGCKKCGKYIGLLNKHACGKPIQMHIKTLGDVKKKKNENLTSCSCGFLFKNKTGKIKCPSCGNKLLTVMKIIE